MEKYIELDPDSKKTVVSGHIPLINFGNFLLTTRQLFWYKYNGLSLWVLDSKVYYFSIDEELSCEAYSLK